MRRRMKEGRGGRRRRPHHISDADDVTDAVAELIESDDDQEGWKNMLINSALAGAIAGVGSYFLFGNGSVSTKLGNYSIPLTTGVSVAGGVLISVGIQEYVLPWIGMEDSVADALGGFATPVLAGVGSVLPMMILAPGSIDGIEGYAMMAALGAGASIGADYVNEHFLEDWI